MKIRLLFMLNINRPLNRDAEMALNIFLRKQTQGFFVMLYYNEFKQSKSKGFKMLNTKKIKLLQLIMVSTAVFFASAASMASGIYISAAADGGFVYALPDGTMTMQVQVNGTTLPAWTQFVAAGSLVPPNVTLSIPVDKNKNQQYSNLVNPNPSISLSATGTVVAYFIYITNSKHECGKHSLPAAASTYIALNAMSRGACASGQCTTTLGNCTQTTTSFTNIGHYGETQYVYYNYAAVTVPSTSKR